MAKMPKINELRVAGDHDLIKLKDRMKQQLPDSIIVYGLLVSRLKYEGSLAATGINILYSDTSSLVVVTPILSQREAQTVTFYWDEEREDDEGIAHLLGSIPNFDWNKPVYFYSTPPALAKKVEKMITSGHLGDKKLKPLPMNFDEAYCLTTAPNVEVSLPEGYEMRPTRASDAQWMHSNWKCKHTETLDGYTALIDELPGFVIVKRDCPKQDSTSKTSTDNQGCDDLPVAWAHSSAHNSFCNTFTSPHHRRLGLARTATLALATKMIQDTGIAVASVTPNNEASAKFHENLGFTRTCKLGFQFFSSPTLKTVFDDYYERQKLAEVE